MNSRIDVTGVRSSCETARREVVLHACQRRALGHEDRPEDVAGDHRRAERQHEHARDQRRGRAVADHDQHDADRRHHHRRQQRREHQHELCATKLEVGRRESHDYAASSWGACSASRASSTCVRNAVEIPHEPDRGERAQDVVGDVDLPPEEALARGDLIVMVVVVPTLAERDRREHGLLRESSFVA